MKNLILIAAFFITLVSCQNDKTRKMAISRFDAIVTQEHTITSQLQRDVNLLEAQGNVKEAAIKQVDLDKHALIVHKAKLEIKNIKEMSSDDMYASYIRTSPDSSLTRKVMADFLHK
jgi:hypothetical protein